MFLLPAIRILNISILEEYLLCMKISKKSLNVLIEQIVNELEEDGNPFGEVFPDEEYVGFVESNKAHIERIVANIHNMMELAGDTPGYDFEHLLRVALKLQQMIERL